MRYLDFLQKVNNFLYDIFGLNDFTLELQVFINSKRADGDVVDSSDVVYVDENGKEFVQ